MAGTIVDSSQTTVGQKLRFVGIGLHSGRPVTLEILPARADTGIVFQRTDLTGAAPLPAVARGIRSTELSTTIGSGVNSISTIEHLMAAFVGLGLDNVLVRLDGPEVPIMDGSAQPFVEALLHAGTRKVGGGRRLLLVKETFEVRDGQRLMRVEPADKLSFHCEIEFASAVIGRQSLDFTFGRSAFLELSGARTFCHVKEVNAMRAAGLALGGSLDNAIVVTDAEVMNTEGLRTRDEFVRHKLLDFIGDLGLLGAPLVGKVTLVRNGHGLHARFMQELLARKAELLTEVEIGAFTSRRPAMSERLQVVAAAAAIYG